MMKLDSAPNFLGLTHRVADSALKKMGFRWELRRSGELKIGLWRKSWGKRKAQPKRFVVMPGFGDTPLSWFGPMGLASPSIKKEFDEIVFMDYPGFQGWLSEEKAFHDMELLFSATFDVLDSLGPHTIMGHSLGGWTAAAYGGQCGFGSRPELGHPRYKGPERLILVNPSGIFIDYEQIEAWRKPFEESREMGFDKFRPHLFAKEPIWFPLLKGSMDQFFYKEEVKKFMDSVDERHMINHHLEVMKAEVWLLWGEKDSIVPVPWLENWLKILNGGDESWREEYIKPNRYGTKEPPQPLSEKVDRKKAQGVVIKRCGHSPQVERPAVTAYLVSQIVSQGELTPKVLPQAPRPWSLME